MGPLLFVPAVCLHRHARCQTGNNLQTADNNRIGWAVVGVSEGNRLSRGSEITDSVLQPLRNQGWRHVQRGGDLPL